MRVHTWLSIGWVVALLQTTVGGQQAPRTADAVKARLTSLLQQIDAIVDATDDLVLEQAELFTTELPNPTVGEIWFLVQGESATATGLRGVIFLIYAFDGHELRGVWSPRAMSAAKLRMTDGGFVIEHVLRDVEPWRTVEDRYASPSTDRD